MNLETVILQQLKETGRSWSLTARITAAGDLIIEGHDLSADLSGIFGEGVREYEYVITVRAGDLAGLLQALDAGADLLQALKTRFGPPQSLPVRAFLKDYGIESEFWSRMGD